jgi:hypothetical protein
MYFWWKFLLEKFSLWLFWDFFITGTFLCVIYFAGLFFVFRKNFVK